MLMAIAADISKEKLADLAKRNQITYLGIFGSYARGEAGADSDVDMLVEFGKRISLMDLVRVEREMGEAIQKKVDLIPRDSINKYVKPYIMKDLITIYGEG